MNGAKVWLHVLSDAVIRSTDLSGAGPCGTLKVDDVTFCYDSAAEVRRTIEALREVLDIFEAREPEEVTA